MSSLNPFSARREKKEAAIKDKIEQLQQQQLGAQQPGGGSELMMGDAPPAFQGRDSGDYEKEDFDKYLPGGAQAEGAVERDWSVPSSGGSYYEPPSRFRQCGYRLQNAFVIGASLGGAVGFMYGTYAAIAYKHVLYLPIAVLQAAGGFGFFLACGTVIRCDELPALAQHSQKELLAAAVRQPAPYAARRHSFETEGALRLCLRDAVRNERSAVVQAVVFRD